jgi:GT2 family glycosyltransferase
MNPVLILTMNNLALTKRCIESVRVQDVGDIVPCILDNASTDGTPEWLHSQCATIKGQGYTTNRGVSFGWNDGLKTLFKLCQEDHVLVIGNDTVIPPWFYRELLSYDQPFVTGVAVDDMAMIAQPPDQRYPLTENPDFSAFLIRRDCWEKVGPFDERMKLYSSDQDYHIRAHRKGVRLYKACVPYYHERSSTLNNACPSERAEIEQQANADRQVLRQKWGCSAGGPDYEALFSPEYFGIELEQIRSYQKAPVKAECDKDA